MKNSTMHIEIGGERFLWVTMKSLTGGPDRVFYIDDGSSAAIMECWEGPWNDEHGSYSRNLKTLGKQYATPEMQESWEKSTSPHGIDRRNRTSTRTHMKMKG